MRKLPWEVGFNNKDASNCIDLFASWQGFSLRSRSLQIDLFDCTCGTDATKIRLRLSVTQQNKTDRFIRLHKILARTLPSLGIRQQLLNDMMSYYQQPIITKWDRQKKRQTYLPT